jgi:hypothetical protein
MWVYDKMMKKLLIMVVLGLIVSTAFTTATALNTNSKQETKNDNETNFFKIEKIKGHWRFIDSKGEPFFSTGICGVSSGSFYSPATEVTRIMKT